MSFYIDFCVTVSIIIFQNRTYLASPHQRFLFTKL
jgi:hypothetical protein